MNEIYDRFYCGTKDTTRQVLSFFNNTSGAEFDGQVSQKEAGKYLQALLTLKGILSGKDSSSASRFENYRKLLAQSSCPTNIKEREETWASLYHELTDLIQNPTDIFNKLDKKSQSALTALQVETHKHFKDRNKKPNIEETRATLRLITSTEQTLTPFTASPFVIKAAAVIQLPEQCVVPPTQQTSSPKIQHIGFSDSEANTLGNDTPSIGEPKGSLGLVNLGEETRRINGNQEQKANNEAGGIYQSDARYGFDTIPNANKHNPGAIVDYSDPTNI